MTGEALTTTSDAGLSSEAALPRRRGRWLVVAFCGLCAIAHIGVIVCVRVAETREELDGLTGDWPAVLAFSAAVAREKRMEPADALRAAETVRAVAPGSALALRVLRTETSTLASGGRRPLANEMILAELDLADWSPTGEAATLARSGLVGSRLEGAVELERPLAERAARELPPEEAAYFHQWLTALLVEQGEYEEALEHFSAAQEEAPPDEIYAPALRAAAEAHRALGGDALAAPLDDLAREAYNGGAMDRSRELPTFGGPDSRRLVAATGVNEVAVDAHAPQADWQVVLTTDLGGVLYWLGLTVCLALLAAFPPEPSPGRPLREVVGGLALTSTVLSEAALTVVGQAGGPSGAGMFFWVAPFSTTRTVLDWAIMLFGVLLLTAALGVAVLEGQSLRDLGWRAGRRLWLYIPLGLLVAVLVASGGIRTIIGYAEASRGWAPFLLGTSLTMALIAGFVEETLYRGYMLRGLLKLQGRFWLANLVQATVFTANHALRKLSGPGMEGWAAACSIGWWFAFSLIVGWMTRKSRSLWPAFALHVVFDVFVMYARALPVYEIARMSTGLL